MDNVRELEMRFKDEIKYHIFRFMPKLDSRYLLFKPSSEYEDSSLSYDAIFNSNFTLSIRIRRNYALRYKDITIRSKSKNGYKTEIDKIMEGMGQLYFYAYMNESETRLVKIRVVDIDVIRKMTLNNQFEQRKNKNDPTHFYVYSFKDIAENKGGLYKYDCKN